MAKSHEWEMYYLLDRIWEEKDFLEEDIKVLLRKERYEDLIKYKKEQENYIKGLEQKLINSYLKTNLAKKIIKNYNKLIDTRSKYVYESIYDEEKNNGIIKLKNKISNEQYSLLEKIINHEELRNPHEYTKKEKALLNGYYRTGNDYFLNDFLEMTESKAIKEVDYLGPGVLGMYIPETDSIYVVRSLTGPIRDFVIAHEKAHRRRAYAGESQNEEAVDAEARATTGISIYR